MKYSLKQVREARGGEQDWTMTLSVSDDYFVSNIEKVDSVTLLRKDKLMTGRTWTLRFQHAITTWPNLNNLGSESCASTVCGACEKARAKTMLQMFGQPYNNNTLSTLPPDQDAMLNRVRSSIIYCLLCTFSQRNIMWSRLLQTI